MICTIEFVEMETLDKIIHILFASIEDNELSGMVGTTMDSLT